MRANCRDRRDYMIIDGITLALISILMKSNTIIPPQIEEKDWSKKIGKIKI